MILNGKSWRAACAGALAWVTAAMIVFAPAPPAPAAAPAASAPPAAAQPASSAPGAPPLTSEDVGAWLDGFVPYALHAADIAGAVVLVVKDDKVLVARGYGYADVASRRPMDPQTTLVHIASISKLFTWTAVMQQVESGKLDLDADVNRYLDFRITPKDGKPVTLRELMTHTGGFEEMTKVLSPPDAAHFTPLAELLRDNQPRRIFPPGEVVAYSNYGAALAGYIVQRVSGEPFETYVEQHILTPLGMRHSTFRQPLPPDLAGEMATGYQLGSGHAQPNEYDNLAPTGALTTSGVDIARFMIAHLNDGRLGDAQILSPATAQRMHATAFRTVPTLNGMALGFFEGDRNGHRVLGHGGDVNYMHSDLELVMDQHVGLFISMNSAGAPGANLGIRLELLKAFLDRYFPAPTPQLPRLPTAVADGKRVAGEYVLSRRSATTVFTGQNAVLQARVTADANGDLSVPILDGMLGSPPRLWREVSPMIWQEAGGKSRIAALVKDGRILGLTTDCFPAILLLQPAPFELRQSVLGPALGGAIAVLALFALFWPIGAAYRRRYGGKFALTGRAAAAYRLARAAAVADVAFIVAWMALILGAFGDTSGEAGNLDPWFRGLQLLALFGLAGAVAALFDLARVWRDPSQGWATRLGGVLVVLAMAIVIWAQLSIRVFNLSLAY